MKNINEIMFGYTDRDALELEGKIYESHIVKPNVFGKDKDYMLKLLVIKDDGQTVEELRWELIDAFLKNRQILYPKTNYRKSASCPISAYGDDDSLRLLKAHTKGSFKGEEVAVPIFDARNPGVDVRELRGGREIKSGSRVRIKILFRPYPLYPKTAMEKTEVDENGVEVKFVEVGVTITLLSVTILDEPEA